MILPPTNVKMPLQSCTESYCSFVNCSTHSPPFSTVLKSWGRQESNLYCLSIFSNNDFFLLLILNFILLLLCMREISWIKNLQNINHIIPLKLFTIYNCIKNVRKSIPFLKSIKTMSDFHWILALDKSIKCFVPIII